MALQQPVGFLDDRSWGFLHLKVSDVAQRLPIHPFSNTLEKMEKLCSSELLYLKKREAAVGSGSDNWGSKANLLDQNNSDWQLAGKQRQKVQWFLTHVGVVALRWWMEVVITYVVQGTFRGGHTTSGFVIGCSFQGLPHLIWQFSFAHVFNASFLSRHVDDTRNTLELLKFQCPKKYQTSRPNLLLLLWLETTSF